MAIRLIDLISKKKLHEQHTFSFNQQKTNLHVQHAFLSFSCRCFARLQRCFVRLKRQTSFYGGIVVCAYSIFCFLSLCSLLFFTAAHFHLAGRQHFSFSHRRFEFPCFLPTRFVSFVFNNSLQLFLCYPLSCKHKKIRLCCCFFLSKSPGGRVMVPSRNKTLSCIWVAIPVD